MLSFFFEHVHKARDGGNRGASSRRCYHFSEKVRRVWLKSQGMFSLGELNVNILMPVINPADYS